jgi:hypothetical protein
MSVDGWGWAALLALLAVYAVAALTHLAGLRWNFDEGIALNQARLMLDGSRLYSVIWTDHPPGQPILISWAFRALGPTVAAGRAVTVVLSLTGLLAAALTARELARTVVPWRPAAWLAALASAAMLAVAPNFWWASRAAMKGIAASSPAAMSMACALMYLRTERRRWLVGSGLALGLSLWVKYQMAYLGPLLGVIVLWVRLRAGVRAGASRAAGDLAVLALTSLGPLLLGAVVYDARSYLAQVFGTYAATRANTPLDLSHNLDALVRWLSADNAGLLVLALCGSALLLLRPSAAALVVWAWWALTVVTVLQHGSLSVEDHFEPILFPMTALAGVPVAWLAHRLARRLRPAPDAGAPTVPAAAGNGWRRVAGALAVLVALVGLSAYVATLPHVLRIDASLRIARNYDNDGGWVELDADEVEALTQGSRRNRAILDFIRAHSRAGDMVIAEEAIFAFHAGRRVPPELAAHSVRRVAIGAISDAELTAAATRYAPPVVVLWRSSYRQFPGFMAWLAANYELRSTFDGSGIEGYVRRVTR